MITRRRATERHRVERRKHTVWSTFSRQDHSDPLAGGFGALEMLNEDHLSPGAAIVLHPRHGAEIDIGPNTGVS